MPRHCEKSYAMYSGGTISINAPACQGVDEIEVGCGMGKQAKSMPAKRMGSTRTQRNGARPTPYSKKAHVEVRYEGARPKPMDGKLGNLEAVAPELSAKAKGKAKALDTPISKSITSSIPIAPLAQIPASTFVIIAGSYEKLLYGLEGSYKSNSGKPTLKPIFIFPAHLACVKAVAASPGGKWLATGSEDEFVKVWDLRRRKEVGSLSQHEGEPVSFLQ